MGPRRVPGGVAGGDTSGRHYGSRTQDWRSSGSSGARLLVPPVTPPLLPPWGVGPGPRPEDPCRTAERVSLYRTAAGGEVEVG